jgi:hypothetical protein
MSVLQNPILTAADAVAVVRALVPDGEVEGTLVVGLDRERRLCGVATNPRHRALSFVKVWELSALVDELEASTLVLAVFPSGPDRPPTEHEIESFGALCGRAHRAGVRLLDCVVVRGESWWSLCELHLERLDV